MMSRCALFDDDRRSAFLPFTYSRPSSELRFGILTMKEKWEWIQGWEASWLTLPYLRAKFPFPSVPPEYLINGRIVPERPLLDRLKELEVGQALYRDEVLLGVRIEEEDADRILSAYDEEGVEGLARRFAGEGVYYDGAPMLLERKWELFTRNEEALKADHSALKDRNRSLQPSPSNSVIGDEIHIEEGAKVEHATLNAEKGPIHIAEGAEVMEGAMIRGPFYLGPHAVVKMGAKIYGSTSIGPYSKVGGELNNCVFFGYSNKAHDGFLGNSVVGEWCNLGADTNNSNLKNNYGAVKVWDHVEEGFTNSGLTFCGLFMGDHSKCGIDTMFNTGTTIGFSANVFDAGFPPKFIPSFFWGGSKEGATFDLAKAKEVGHRMRERRGLPFGQDEERIFDTVFRMTEKERKTLE